MTSSISRSHFLFFFPFIKSQTNWLVGSNHGRNSLRVRTTADPAAHNRSANSSCHWAVRRGLVCLVSFVYHRHPYIIHLVDRTLLCFFPFSFANNDISHLPSGCPPSLSSLSPSAHYCALWRVIFSCEVRQVRVNLVFLYLISQVYWHIYVYV